MSFLLFRHCSISEIAAHSKLIFNFDNSDITYGCGLHFTA